MSKYSLTIVTLYLCCITACFAYNSYRGCDNCCENMGGIQYCDSSSGLYVCQNGDYSVCYCTRHAVMDLQKIEGCCLWGGGVFRITERGIVICNDGSVSELCTLQNPTETVAAF